MVPIENNAISNAVPRSNDKGKTIKPSQRGSDQAEHSPSTVSVNNKYRYLLLGLILFHTIAYIAFRILDKAYQTWDSAGHMALSLRLAELIHNFFSSTSSLDRTTLYDIITESNYYPPLVHLVTSVFILLFGTSFNIQLGLIFIAFLITIVVFYKLVVEVGFSHKLAFFSTFFFSLYPLIGDQARLFHLEIPLTLTILLCYKFLLRSKNFTNLKYSTLFFLAFCATQLIKWYGFIFLIVPVLLALFNGYKAGSLKMMMRNISIGSIIFLFLTLPWYILNYEELTLLSSLFSVGEADDPQVFWSIENFTFYLTGMFAYHLYLIPTLATFVGAFIYYRDDKKNALLLFVHISIVFAVFTFIENKNRRYIFLLSLVFAFLSAYLVEKVNKKQVTIFLAGISIIYFLLTTFNQLENESAEANAWGKLMAGPYYKLFAKDATLYSYRKYRPPIKEVFEFIKNDAELNDIDDIGITPLVDSTSVSTANLEMVKDSMRLNGFYLPVPYFQFQPFKSDYEIIKYLRDKNVSYVIVPEFVGPSNLRNFEALTQASNFMRNSSAQWYTKLKTFETPDNDLTIYKRIEADLPIGVNECREIGEGHNVFVVEIEPLASAVLFTGHYNFNGVTSEYDDKTLNILEINNFDVKKRTLTITDLPHDGFSYCHRLGTRLKLRKEIASALIDNKYSCGAEKCENVKHTKVNLDDTADVETKYYTVGDFVGSGMNAVLKRMKVLPYYESEYSIKDDVYVGTGEF